MLSSFIRTFSLPVALCASLVVLLFSASSATAGDFSAKKSIAGELRFPSVSALAVGFYSPGCASCREALPKWRTYQKRFGPQGAVVRLFQPLKDGERCHNKRSELAGFKVICDVGGIQSESPEDIALNSQLRFCGHGRVSSWLAIQRQHPSHYTRSRFCEGVQLSWFKPTRM